MPAAPPDPLLPVVTGLGVVSSIGAGVERFWAAVQAGTSSARPVQGFSTAGLRNHYGCEIDDRELAGYESLPRASRLAAIAASEALDHARLLPEEVGGLCVGTTMGDLPEVERELGEAVGERWECRLRETVGAHFGERIAAAVGVRGGPVVTLATSCSAGNLAICRAVDLIRAGRLPSLLAGGADAFSHLAFLGFSRMRAMAPERCTPFSRQRKGMLLGEGAAFLVLESLAAAQARGAEILGAVVGYGLSCDAYHVATPDPTGRGAAQAIRLALRSGGLAAERVSYICAHGTGTPANDLAESRACRQVFTDRVPPLSSVKALIGHALGGASAIEAAASVMSLRQQRLIPAWHVDEPDPECGVPLALPGGEADPGAIDLVLSNAFAFGGNNSCIALGRIEPLLG
ncbi:MAG TPA: beta-ketoacyl-[acyl-carrier-protein] synthase family protein [Thermoanaerobaculia bacterium]|nr:beta-ketoacyl-[acyl-carrier-protein] synthase family protein [Thermoanaerobaculia bacterium]